KVADLFCGCGNAARERSAAPFFAPLLRPEEEDPVLYYGAAEIAAVVVVTQDVLGLVALVEKETVGVERVVPEELKDAAVELVGAALGDQVDHCALGLAELGAEAVALDAKFLNRVDRWKGQQRGVRADVHVIDAVDRPHVLIRTVAVHRHIHVGIETRAISAKSSAGASLSHRRDSGDKQHQLGVVAAVERQLCYLFLANETADFAAPRIDLFGLASDRDDFGHLADLEGQVHHKILADVQLQIAVDGLLEPGRRSTDRVTANRQAGSRIETIFVSSNCPYEAGPLFLY